MIYAGMRHMFTAFIIHWSAERSILPPLTKISFQANARNLLIRFLLTTFVEMTTGLCKITGECYRKRPKLLLCTVLQ